MSSYGVREDTGGGDWIMNTVSRNPEGLLLLGAGVALLMRSSRQSAKYRHPKSTSLGGGQYPGRREGMGERVGEAARRAGEYVSDTTDKVSETARSYASSAAEYADEATERSRRMAEQARETADYVVGEQPWAVALAGILAGVAVAAAFPPTRIERRTLGEAGEHLRSAIGHISEQLVEAGTQAGERLSQVAEERGLTSEGLKEAARDVGEAFSSSLSGEEGRSAQASNRRKPREEAGSRSQNRPTQGGGTPRAGGPQSGGPQSSGKGGNTAPSGGQSAGPQSFGKGGNTAPSGGRR